MGSTSTGVRDPLGTPSAVVFFYCSSTKSQGPLQPSSRHTPPRTLELRGWSRTQRVFSSGLWSLSCDKGGGNNVILLQARDNTAYLSVRLWVINSKAQHRSALWNCGAGFIICYSWVCGTKTLLHLRMASAVWSPMLRTFRIAGLKINHVILYFIGQSWFAEPRY